MKTSSDPAWDTVAERLRAKRYDAALELIRVVDRLMQLRAAGLRAKEIDQDMAVAAHRTFAGLTRMHRKADAS